MNVDICTVEMENPLKKTKTPFKRIIPAKIHGFSISMLVYPVTIRMDGVLFTNLEKTVSLRKLVDVS
jgi:hypothetical protein